MSPLSPVQPVLQEWRGALSAPELFARLSGRRGVFFLDSARVAGGLGRYSFLGFEPFLTFTVRGDAITLSAEGRTEMRPGNPWEELRRLLGRHRCARDPRLPFTGGAVGGFGYELGRRLEVPVAPGQDDLGLPDLCLGFYDGLLAFDHATGQHWLVACPVHTAAAEQILTRLEDAIRTAESGPPPETSTPGSAEPRSNFSRPDYHRAVERVRDYIAAGDVYQVNLSQRFSAPLPCPPAGLYARLRERSPAPFACYFDFGDVQLVGSSPERFLRLRGDRLETRPVKGTRPRGATPEEDARLRAELLASEKDRAELLMIVDLERNDLGRVCEFGTVRVDDLHHLEEHPGVFHLVANVAGRLRPGLDAIDCLRAAFPGGSITGAPKIRAMEIIAELEPHRRHFYTGAVGYLGFDGDCDLNIAIRTILCAGGQAHYFVGGGVVWDSTPESEYQETLDKGRAMHAALRGPSGAAAGIFETIKVAQGRPVLLAEHCARLAASAGALGLGTSPALGMMPERAAAMIAARNLAAGVLKVTLSPAGLACSLEPPRYAPGVPSRGFRLLSRRMETALSAHKLVARPHLDEARRSARDAGADDALLLDAAGQVLEGTVCNVFVVHRGRVLTPPLDGRILPGIIRGLLLAAPGLPPVEEIAIPATLLAEADEVFVTNSLLGVMPVAQVDGGRFDLRCNPVTRAYAEHYRRIEAASLAG